MFKVAADAAGTGRRRLAGVGTALLGVIVVMLLPSFAAYPGFAGQPNPWGGVLVLFTVLSLYAAPIVIVWRGPSWLFLAAAAPIALVWGPIAGALEMAAILIENIPPPAEATPAITLTFMGLSFACWAVPALLVNRSRPDSLAIRISASVFTAAIGVLCAVIAGLTIEVLLSPPLDRDVATWAEYLRSGWSDPHSFILANTIDSAWTHLVLGPIFAAALASLVGVASFIHPRSRRPANPTARRESES